MADVKDLTFRIDRTNNAIISRGGEHVLNVVQMMFNTVPGEDEYNTDMGLNIGAAKHHAHPNGSRYTEYEARIENQFLTYTDLIPVQVIVLMKDGRMIIYMRLRFMDTIYEVDITEENDSLSAILRNA